MRFNRRALLAVTAISLATASLVGCSTPGYKKADSAATDMTSASSAAEQFVVSAQNVQTYFASMEGTELKPLFAKFEKEVDNFDSSAKRLRDSIKGVRSSTNDYMASLRKTAEAISNTDLKAKTEARLDTISKQLADIDEAAKKVDSAGGVLAKHFGDARQFLRADLSMRAVKEAAPMWNSVDADIGTLRTGVIGLKKELGDLSEVLASGS